MRVQRLAEVEATEYARLMQRSAADVQRVLPQVQAIMEAVRQPFGSREQNGRRVLTVFRLRQEIRRDKGCWCGVISDNQDFRGAWGTINGQW